MLALGWQCVLPLWNLFLPIQVDKNFNIIFVLAEAPACLIFMFLCSYSHWQQQNFVELPSSKPNDTG
jgi:hypothetical protein